MIPYILVKKLLFLVNPENSLFSFLLMQILDMQFREISYTIHRYSSLANKSAFPQINCPPIDIFINLY